MRIVLVGPQHAPNVGAVARVAANFAIDDVRVVAAECDWRVAGARKLAKGEGSAIFEAIRESRDLAGALAGCSAAIGFTRRIGAGRAPTVALAALHDVAREGAALVFGREDGGLTGGELARCTHVCTIPTAARMPSLNLSHAVAVVCARLFEEAAAEQERESGGGNAAGGRAKNAAAPIDEFHRLLAHLEQLARDAGLTRGGNPERLLDKLRPALGRARLSGSELAAFRALFSKVQISLGTKVNRRRAPRGSS